MDDDSFDAFARSLAGRRRIILAALAAGLATAAPVAAKRRKHKRKYKPKCGAGNRFCQGRCIGRDGCCTDSECRARGACASCQAGKCLPDGRICTARNGPCSRCNSATSPFTCEPSPDGARCDACRVCQQGSCVGCRALGECAGCQHGNCVLDGQLCAGTYNACSLCDATTLTCTHGLTPCAVGEHTVCCTADESCCPRGCCKGTCCGEECADLDRSQDHCGACFRACLANQRCDGGACSCAAYQSGTTWCESAHRCIREVDICCGQKVCASNMFCCGSGDEAFCWPVPQCPS